MGNILPSICHQRSGARKISLMRAPEEPASQVAELRRAADGDTAAWAKLLERHRARLRRMVALRLDRRLQGRVDASDVIQEAAIVAMRDLPNYLRKPELPFFLWLRVLVGQTISLQHRIHLGVRARDAGREIRIYDGPMPWATSAALAARLLGRDTRPSVAAARAERKLRLQETLDSLDPIDREVLVLRHFEELSAEETARALGIERSAAGQRYLRALKRLRNLIGSSPDGGEGLRP
jgi:RNA polymerase sigma-70 factor, ECF subfamily